MYMIVHVFIELMHLYLYITYIYSHDIQCQLKSITGHKLISWNTLEILMINNVDISIQSYDNLCDLPQENIH